MRICDLTTLYIDGGAGGVNTYLMEKARYLAEYGGGTHHTIIVPGAQNTRQSLFNSTIYTIKSPRFFYNPHHRILAHYWQVKQLLRATKPDVIEVDCVYFLGRWAQAAMGARHVPLVGFYHTHLPSLYARPVTLCFGERAAQILEAWAWRYMTYCMQPLDCVLVASNAMYTRLVTSIAKKVEYVALGVNLELFAPRTCSGLEAERQRPVILYVGRLSQEKDLAVLCEAFRLLNKRGAYQLHIVGDGPLRPQIEAFVRSTAHTLYTGMIPYGERLAALYATADVLALPSRNETFGLTILEALASGIPAVAIHQGGPLDLVHARVGALAAPGDAGDFATKLEQVLGDKSLAQHCRVYAAEHFSWDKTFMKLLTIYETLHTCERKDAASLPSHLPPAYQAAARPCWFNALAAKLHRTHHD
ncbi:MAG: glycosyltransferase [Candidatus Tectimicrobiota bacterium]